MGHDKKSTEWLRQLAEAKTSPKNNERDTLDNFWKTIISTTYNSETGEYVIIQREQETVTNEDIFN